MESDDSPIHVEYLPTLKDPLFVAAFEGWNDGGQSASNAVRHLVKVLNAEKFAWIDSSRQPVPEPPCLCFWSWGGIDAATRARIAEALGPETTGEDVDLAG